MENKKGEKSNTVGS